MQTERRKLSDDYSCHCGKPSWYWRLILCQCTDLLNGKTASIYVAKYSRFVIRITPPRIRYVHLQHMSEIQPDSSKLSDIYSCHSVRLDIAIWVTVTFCRLWLLQQSHSTPSVEHCVIIVCTRQGHLSQRKYHD